MSQLLLVITQLLLQLRKELWKKPTVNQMRELLQLLLRKLKLLLRKHEPIKHLQINVQLKLLQRKQLQMLQPRQKLQQMPQRPLLKRLQLELLQKPQVNQSQ
jgi:hypothetical protein